MAVVLYIVVPCYNEQEVLPETVSRLTDKLQSLIDRGLAAPKSRLLFVNDGSKDTTWTMICDFHRQNSLISGVNLSRNRGHQNALLAGLMTARSRCDVSISMDADLQDDIDAVDEMLERYHDGCDIVYGVRKKRDTDTFFKRASAQGFYKLTNSLGGEVVYNHADYRLMSRRALDGLAEYGEVNLFLRGIVPMLGYKTAEVYYDRAPRFAGESKYPLKKMLAFALEGITSLSTRPIRFITWIGVLIFLVSIIMLIYILVQHFTGHTVAGWSSMTVSIWAIGGLIMLSLGIIGEYVGKIYLETKHRPRYHIGEVLEDE